MSPAFYLTALTTLTGCTLYCVHAADIAAYIVNGNRANNGSYPWQLSFQRRSKNKWYHICGGSLIDERFAVTASHCLYNGTRNANGTFESYLLANLRVVAGANIISPLEPDREIHSLESAITPFGLHPFFDVALLKLRTPVNISRSDISPITIAEDADDVTGRQCWVTGWGSTTRDYKRLQFSPILQEAAMTLVEMTDCRAAGWRGLSPLQTCATGNPRENTICAGDSGGPLTCVGDDGTPILMGISSLVYKQCETARPNVFAKVSVYRQWLRRFTGINDL